MKIKIGSRFRMLRRQVHQAPASFVLIAVITLVYSTYFTLEIPALEFIHSGGNFPPYTLGREPWRLITSMFLHGNLIHLLFNATALYSIGPAIERELGWRKFLGVYFITGLVAGYSSLVFNLFVVSVGASGAIFGLFGFELATSLYKGSSNRIAVIINFVVFMILNLALGAVMNADLSGHLGGLISGIMLGILVYHGIIKSVISKVVLWVVILLSFLFLPRYQTQYFEAYQRFIAGEQTLIRIFDTGKPDKELLKAIEQNENLPDSLIDQFRSIQSLPRKLIQDRDLLVSYLELKKEELHFFKKGILKQSFIYHDSIEFIRAKMGQLPPLSYSLNLNTTESDIQVSRSHENLQPVVQGYDSLWYPCEMESAEFYRRGFKDSLGEWHGLAFDFYGSGAIQMKGHYAHGLKNGVFIFYNEDSTYSSAGKYENDFRIGKWESFHENNQLGMESSYTETFSGILNAWNEKGELTVQAGEGFLESWDSSGNRVFHAKVVNGKYHGVS